MGLFGRSSARPVPPDKVRRGMSIATFDDGKTRAGFMGMRYHVPAFLEFVEPRELDVVAKGVRTGQAFVYLVPNPTSRFGRSTIEVWAEGIGYVGMVGTMEGEELLPLMQRTLAKAGVRGDCGVRMIARYRLKPAMGPVTGGDLPFDQNWFGGYYAEGVTALPAEAQGLPCRHRGP